MVRVIQNPEALERAARLADEPLRTMGRSTTFFGGAVLSIREVWTHRELLGMLVRRELRARYKDSSLGMVWSLVRPLVQLLIYYLVMGKFLSAERAIPDFAVYVFSGLTTWGLFSEIVSVGTGSVVANAGIIKKIHLPREIFPLSTVGSALFNFSIQFTILVIAALALGGINTDVNLIYLPLSVLLVLVWGTSLALLLSAANVYLRDVQYLVEVVMIMGFWLSPIVYSWEMVSTRIPPVFAEIYSWNPVTVAVFGMNRVVWAAGTEANFPPYLLERLGVLVLVGLVVLFVSQRMFDRMQRDFAQEI